MATDFAVGSAVLNTDLGPQQLSISGLGWTPKGIYMLVSSATVDGVAAPHGDWAVCMADDKGNVTSMSIAQEDGADAAAASRGDDQSNGTRLAFIGRSGGSSLDFSATVASNDAVAGPGPDSWTIDITKTPGTPYLCKFLLVGGNIPNVTVGTDAVQRANTVAVGHEVNLLLTATITNIDGYGVHATYSMGAASFDGAAIKQGVVSHWMTNGSGTTNTGSRIDNTACNAMLYSNANPTWLVSLDAVRATEFDLALVTGSGSPTTMGYMAIELPPDVEASVDVLAAPANASSDWSVTAPGFQPQFAMLVPTACPEIGVTSLTTAAAGTFSVSVLDNANRAQCNGVRSEDSVGTSNAKSLADNQWVTFDDASGARAYEVNPASVPWTADGWNVPAADIGAAIGDTRYWLSIAVEDPDVGPEPPTDAQNVLYVLG